MISLSLLFFLCESVDSVHLSVIAHHVLYTSTTSILRGFSYDITAADDGEL